MEDYITSTVHIGLKIYYKIFKITQLKIPTFDHVSVLKGTVSVVSTNSSFENDNVRLPTVSFKALSDQKYELDINVDNFET